MPPYRIRKRTRASVAAWLVVLFWSHPLVVVFPRLPGLWFTRVDLMV